MSRPQAPEICCGLSESFWSFATPRFTGRKSGSHEAEQYSRPQRPTPERRFASSRTPICFNSIRVRNMAARSRTRPRKSTRRSAVKNSVSLRRSHCHSASVSFITRWFAFTRSIDLRRASSFSMVSSRSSCSSAFVARRKAARGGGAVPQPWAQPLQRTSANSPVECTRPKSSPRSASTITPALSGGAVSPVQLKNSFRLPRNATSIRCATA